VIEFCLVLTVGAPLETWYMQFVPFARAAMADKPEWLEPLGILHRST
jgi:hypothetical protein